MSPRSAQRDIGESEVGATRTSGIGTSSEDDAEESGPRARFDPWSGERFEGARNRPSDWGSLVADLSNGSSVPRWRVHDRTHLEFAVHYPVAEKADAHEWEAYFFIPDSLRLDGSTYSKSDIYADLQSYVRFAVPERVFGQIAGLPLERLQKAIRRGRPIEAITRELRLFACAVRAAGVTVQRSIGEALADPDKRDAALVATTRMLEDANRITSGLREALAELPEHETLRTAGEWVDEDVSRLIETLLGGLSVKLKKAHAPKELQERVVCAAVREARYRDASGLEGVGRSKATKREVEHLEFRRHVLKRFTASVLWLAPEVRQGARIVLQVLYALAAGVAMAFAVTAALWNGAPQFSSNNPLWMWSAVAVCAYMGKDRIKAFLQGVFSKLVSKHFPDRRWRIREPETKRVLGKVDEVTGFVDFDTLPAPVLDKRRSTRRHPLEEQARPEKVLWHRKVVRLDKKQIQATDDRFDTLTEIFRLDLRRWLAHTDDPKRRILFAAPDTETICSATAPRVYNIGVVYRLRHADGSDASWRRVRVVVSRKGIQRIDAIPDDPDPIGPALSMMPVRRPSPPG